jgi:molecular chaperone Hsp33
MPDHLATASVPAAGIAIAAAVTTGLVREIRGRHDLSPLAAAAVGRLTSGAVLLAAGLKGRERISLQVVAGGPIGGLLAEAWLLDGGTIGARGYARNPHVDLPLNARGKFDVAAALGSGSLHVIKSHEVGRPYTGVVPLRSGEIAEDIAAYLAHSEQIPSVVALGVLADPDGIVASGGLVAQLLPGAEEIAIGDLERRARETPPVTQLLKQGADADSLIRQIAGDTTLHEHRRFDVRFACLCSRAKVEAALLGLGADDLRRMASERDRTEASCEYCKHDYEFRSEELLELSSQRLRPLD